MFKTFLLLIVISIPLSTYAEEAFFCKECTSSENAKSIAKLKYAPKLQCNSSDPFSPPTPDDAICGSVARNIILVNPEKKSIYSYRVGHSNQAPRYPVMAWDRALSNQDISGYSMVAEYLATYESGIQIATSNAYISKSNTSYVASRPGTTTCPTDTALSTLVNPNEMSNLEDLMTLSIMVGMENSPGYGVMDKLESSSISNTGAGITFGRTNYNVAWSDTTKKPIITWPFANSEELSSIKDYLLFDIESLGRDHNNVPILKFSLSDESRVAGVKLSHLRGKHGPLTITNPCVLNRLGELNDTGQFRNAAGIEDQFNGSTIPANGSIETCTWYFYQSGRLLYIFNSAGGGCS